MSEEENTNQEENERTLRIAGIWDRYFAKIRNHAYRLYSNTQEAEDATMNAFTVLMDKLDIVADGAERSFLMSVINRHYSNWITNKTRATIPFDHVEQDQSTEFRDVKKYMDPPTELLLRWKTRALRECIHDLPEHYKSVIVLEQQELGIRETACRLQISDAAVKFRRWNARQKLRRCLETKGVFGNE